MQVTAFGKRGNPYERKNAAFEPRFFVGNFRSQIDDLPVFGKLKAYIGFPRQHVWAAMGEHNAFRAKAHVIPVLFECTMTPYQRCMTIWPFETY